MKSTILFATVSAFAALANKTIGETQVASSITDISLTADGKILALHTPDPERHPQQSGSIHKVIVLTGKPADVQEKLAALQKENPAIKPLYLASFAKAKKKGGDVSSTAAAIAVFLRILRTLLDRPEMSAKLRS
jgi:hypothetical protein